MAKVLKKRVVIGGTFETLHKGHLALFKRAFKLGSPPHQSSTKLRLNVAEGDQCLIWCGGEVFIGLTSDELAEKLKKRKVKDFKERKKELKEFIKKNFPPEAATIKPKIVKIEDKFGPALKSEFDYIVVSPETYKTARRLNEERKKRGKKPLKIIKVNFVLAEDGKPISDSRILTGEIDSQGKLCI